MPKAPKVRYWPTRKGGGYFCVYQRKQHELALGPKHGPNGPTYLAALDAFTQLMEGKKSPPPNAPTGPTIREVLEAYLARITNTKKPGTVEIRQRSFLPFVNHHTGGDCIGELPVTALSPRDVYSFLEQMEKPRPQKRKKEQKGRKPVGWSAGSKRNCVIGLLAAFNWAAKKAKMIAANPLDGIEKEPATSRSAEALIGNTPKEIEETHAKIMAASRPLLQALKDTGARPGELIAATAADFRPEAGAFLFHKEATRRGDQLSHKTAKKKDRMIFLPGETLELVEELVVLFPTGPIFRRKTDKPFRRASVVDRFLKLQKKLKMPNLTAYSYRHTFATEMLKAGMDVETLAELMGNSAAVIREHYSHLLADAKALREKLERFRRAGGT